MSTGGSETPLPIQHNNGFSHTAGIVCNHCPPDTWPAYSRRYVADLHDRIDAALALCEEEIDCGGRGASGLRSLAVRVRATLTDSASSQRATS